MSSINYNPMNYQPANTIDMNIHIHQMMARPCCDLLRERFDMGLGTTRYNFNGDNPGVPGALVLISTDPKIIEKIDRYMTELGY